MTQQIEETPTPRKKSHGVINGVDTGQLFDTIEAIRADASKASCRFSATTEWREGTVSDCQVSRYVLGGTEIPQDYTIRIDEPAALLGRDSAPNPQMVLFAALNSCVLNTMVINAAARGIRIESVQMELEGELDLRGFLGIDATVNPGYDELTIRCRVKSDGTREQLQACLDAGTRYSPNFQSISKPVSVRYELEVI